MKEVIDRLKSTIKNIFPYFDTDKGEYRIGPLHSLNDKDVSFALIAIRCNTQEGYIRRKLQYGKTYYLLKGYNIEDERIVVSKERLALNHIYNDFSEENLEHIPHIQISAIVGKNGSGKSSLVEFLLRLLNNYATIIKGEVNKDPASERLHYVDKADGDIWYAKNGTIYQLSISNASVRLKEYSRQTEDDNTIYYSLGNTIGIGDEREHKYDGLVPMSCNDDEAKSYLSKIFYTLVSNYSIYAYNTNDFQQECCSIEKERGIRASKKDQYFPVEERCWLHGLFHKNDGYNIPINITPFRSEGNMNINVENQLATERLISLLITQPEYRNINEHLRAKSLRVIPCEESAYGYNAVRTKLGYRNLSKETYQNMRKDIVHLWGEKVGKNLLGYSKYPLYSIAVDYLVYKTLKVSKQYKEHHDFYDSTELSDAYSRELLKSLIDGESKDHSHITRKIFQTIAYIILPVYELVDKQGNSINELFFGDLAGNWHLKAVKGQEIKTRNGAHIVNSALIPPPFYRYVIILEGTNGGEEKIEFSSLSSGEKQQIYSISSILYHLENLNSVAEDEYYPQRIFYENINVILEEIELYFHPEMQRSFVMSLIKGIHSIRLENLKSINFILVTHSPYVLSDIPKDNVLALDFDGIYEGEIKTFGANIHKMLKTSFFLAEGSEGLFAKWEFAHIMACLIIHRWANQDNCDFKEYHSIMSSPAFKFMERYCTIDVDDKHKFFEYERFKEELGKEQLLVLINRIDEPIMQYALLNEYKVTFES